MLPFRTIKKRRAAVEKLFSIINLGVLVSNVSWKNDNTNLLNITNKIVDENMNELKMKYMAVFHQKKNHTEPISARLIFDCS